MVDLAMEGVRRERMQRCKTLYHPITIRSSTLAGRNNSFAQRLVLDTDGAMLYQPGDVICILPENRQQLVEEVVTALNIDGNRIVTVKAKSWIQTLLDRGVENGRSAEDHLTTFTLTVARFLRYASLQPLNSETWHRLQESSSGSSFDDGFSKLVGKGELTNAATAIEFLSERETLAGEQILAKIDSIFEPLKSRNYSIASSAKVTPKSVEIIVGRTGFKTSAEDFSLSLSMSTTEAQIPKWQLKPVLIAGKGMRFKSKEERQPVFRLQHSNDQEVPDMLLPSVSPYTSGEPKDPTIVQGISSSFLSACSPGTVVYARVTPKIRFRLPNEVQAPIVMIGLGTGIAPFMSFIKEFIHEKRATGYTRQKAWLLLGVQTPDHIPFLDELEEAVCKHKVLQLSIAFSRADVDFCQEESKDSLVFRPGSRKRVQSLLWDNHETLKRFWDIIADKGHVYLCGKPQLEPFIREAINKAVSQFGKSALRAAFPDSTASAEDLSSRFPYLLAAQRRLHISTYNGGRRQSTPSNYVLPSEVAQHRSMGSCFVIFRGFVYDLTTFLTLHPGGAKLLFDKAGRDITEDFNVAHGRDQNPIVAMIEPYRIGTLYRFPEHCCARILRFMQEWSLPLLHGVLEHRSVFLMELNNFPELERLQSDALWTSQLSSPEGQASICRKFWKVHERQLFEYIQKETSSERLGKFLSNLSTTVVDVCDLGSLQEDIIASRDAGFKMKGAGLCRPKTEIFLLKCSDFMDQVVEVFVDVQRIVESALQKSTSETTLLPIYHSLSESVEQTVISGIVRAYVRLPMDYLY